MQAIVSFSFDFVMPNKLRMCSIVFVNIINNLVKAKKQSNW